MQTYMDGHITAEPSTLDEQDASLGLCDSMTRVIFEGTGALTRSLL